MYFVLILFVYLSCSINNIMENTSKMINWLEKKISKLTEKNKKIESDNIKLKINNGSKLKTYKECLEFIKTH